MASGSTMPDLNLLCGPQTAPREFDAATRAPNAVIGVAILIAAEVIFFGGLVTAFLVLRASAIFWPPPNQPRLPVFITAINTIVLLVSGVTMRLGVSALRREQTNAFERSVVLTTLLGGIFVLVQGNEWFRLVASGLRLGEGVYGGLFTTIISVHALHAVGGLIALAIATIRARQGCYTLDTRGGVEACMLYWLFVVAVWPVLYGLVYLA